MNKHFKTTAIAAFMAVLMAVFTPLQSFAASQKLYISDIRMSESKDKLVELGYTVLDKDLNAGTSWYDAANAKTISRYTYIGYKTTTDPNDAITDISVMDMKGGYSFGDYEEMLNRQKKTVGEQIKIYRIAIDEFRNRYAEGGIAAKLAYTSLNNYIEDDSGRLLGDMFTDPNLSEADLLKIFMQGTIMVNSAIIECLTVGLSDGGESWLNKLSSATKTDADYYDESVGIFESVENIRSTLEQYLDYGADINDETAFQKFTDEHNATEINELLNAATLYKTLAAHKYGDGTAADLFISPDIDYEDLYPLISVLTPGQLAIAQMSGFATLIKTADTDDAAWSKAETEAGANNIKVSTAEKISVYAGTDRSMYNGGVALTNDAKRKAASTGDTSWYYGNMNEAAETLLMITSGFAGISVITSVAVLIKAQVVLKSAQSIIFDASTEYSTEVLLKSASDCVWARGVIGTAQVFILVSMAVLLIAVSAYIGLEVHNYYHPTYSDIPLILMDLKFGEDDEIGDWEKYIRYNVVCDENGNAGDLNAWMAKQWNAMYTTKDKAAGNPITVDSLTVKYGDSTIPRDFSPVHYFGSTDAFDLNSHCYNNDENGIFVFFQRDAKAFAADTASVFGSGALAIVTGFGGLIVGALGAVFITRKKKVTTSEV